MANAPARPVQGEAGVGPVALLLLGLVLLVGIGIYLSRSPNVSVAGMTQNTARMEAAALQQTGSAVAGAFGAAMMRDSFLPNQITFDTAARTSTSIGLFNASEGYLAQPAQQTSALVAATVGANPVTWQRMQANITGIGSGSGLYVAVLPNVRQAVCQQLNAAKWSVSPTAAVPTASNVTAANATAGLGAATGVGAVTLDLTATANPANFTTGRDEGCLGSSDGTFFYYKVVAVQ